MKNPVVIPTRPPNYEYPPSDYRNIHGRPSVTVSSKGLTLGTSEYFNDGADFGPDTPGTSTSGIQEAMDYLASSNYVQEFGYAGTVRMNAGTFKITSPITFPSSGYISLEGAGLIDTQIMINASGISGVVNSVDNGFSYRSLKNFNVFSNSLGVSGLDIQSPEVNGQCVVENVSVVGSWSGAPINWVGSENTRFKNVSVVQAGTSPQSVFSVPGGTIYFDDCELDDFSGHAQEITLLNTTLGAFELGGNTGTLLLLNCYQANAFTGTRFSTNGYTLQSFISLGTWHGLSDSSAFFGGGGGAGGAGGAQIRNVRINAYINLLDSTTCKFCDTPDSNGYPYSYYVDMRGTQLNAGSGTLSGFVFGKKGGYVVNHGGFSIATPGVPNSGTAQTNSFAFPVRVYLTSSGTGTAYTLTDPNGNSETFSTTLAVGKEITVDPGGSITLTYTVAPTWVWYAV